MVLSRGSQCVPRRLARRCRQLPPDIGCDGRRRHRARRGRGLFRGRRNGLEQVLPVDRVEHLDVPGLNEVEEAHAGFVRPIGSFEAQPQPDVPPLEIAVAAAFLLEGQHSGVDGIRSDHKVALVLSESVPVIVGHETLLIEIVVNPPPLPQLTRHIDSQHGAPFEPVVLVEEVEHHDAHGVAFDGLASLMRKSPVRVAVGDGEAVGHGDLKTGVAGQNGVPETVLGPPLDSCCPIHAVLSVDHHGHSRLCGRCEQATGPVEQVTVGSPWLWRARNGLKPHDRAHRGFTVYAVEQLVLELESVEAEAAGAPDLSGKPGIAPSMLVIDPSSIPFRIADRSKLV